MQHALTNEHSMIYSSATVVSSGDDSFFRDVTLSTNSDDDDDDDVFFFGERNHVVCKMLRFPMQMDAMLGGGGEMSGGEGPLGRLPVGREEGERGRKYGVGEREEGWKNLEWMT